MYPVKSETSDVGNDSQRIRFKDDNSHIGDTLNINISDNFPDKSLSEEKLLIIAYVKDENTNAFDYNTTDCKGNEEFHEQQLIDIDAIKTEKTEACGYNTSWHRTKEAYSDNTSWHRTEEQHKTIEVEEESEDYHVKEHDIHHVLGKSIQELARVKQ